MRKAAGTTRRLLFFEEVLFQRNLASRFLYLLLPLLRLLLLHICFKECGRALHEILGLLETERERFFDHFDDRYLLLAYRSEFDVKFRLLLSCRSCWACNSDRCRRYAP